MLTLIPINRKKKERHHIMTKKRFLYILGGLLALVLLIQLVPYGRNHSNPPVVQELNWDSAQTQALAERACYDCHSNQTVWPWYSNIAPVSWLIQRDVNEGRSILNFSEANRPQEGLEEAGEVIQSGEMPPTYYVWLHPNANLSAAERSQLIQGLTASAGGQMEGGNEAGEAGE